MTKKLTKNTQVTQKGSKKYLPLISDGENVLGQVGDEVVIEDEFLPYYKELGIIDLDIEDKMRLSESGESNALVYISLKELKTLINSEIQKLEKKYDTELKRLKNQVDNTYKQFTNNLSTGNQAKKEEIAQEVLPSAE